MGDLSMSSMLEDAIIDANALKESAIKNAENTVLEKYSKEVKQAIDKILEEDVTSEEVVNEVDMENMPFAATAGENACPCPEDEEEIEMKKK